MTAISCTEHDLDLNLRSKLTKSYLIFLIYYLCANVIIECVHFSGCITTGDSDNDQRCKTTISIIRKMSCAGHVMRNTSGHYDTLLTTIEGRQEGKREKGRPRRTWVDDLRDWTGSKRYDQIKRAAETRRLHGTFATHSNRRINE